MSSQECCDVCRAVISEARWSGGIVYKQDGRIDPDDLTNRFFQDRIFFAERPWSPFSLAQIVERLLGSDFFCSFAFTILSLHLHAFIDPIDQP